MAELVDAPDSKSGGRKVVWVRVPPPARECRVSRRFLSPAEEPITATEDYEIACSALRSTVSFRERFPEVRVTLHEWTSAVQLERLREGKIEIGFMRAPVEEEGFLTEHVSVEPVVALLMVPRHKEFSSFDRYVSIRQRAGFSPEITQEVFEIHAIVGLVATGMGVAFVPGSVGILRRPGAWSTGLSETRRRA